MAKGRLGVYLGHHQGHLGIQAEGAGVVDHHRPLGHRHRRPLLRHRPAGGGQHQVHPGKGFGGYGLHLQRLAAPLLAHPRRARGSQETQFLNWKTTLPQQGQQFLTHSAGGSKDGNGLRLCRGNGSQGNETGSTVEALRPKPLNQK